MIFPKLLIVDDDEAFRNRLAKSMSRRQYDVLIASNVDDALGKTADFCPDIAIIDLKMPGASGLELVKALRQRFSSIFMIVLTGYGSIASALDAIQSGANDYLTKPADAEQIEMVIRGKRTIADEIKTPSLDRVEWEHIHRVLSDCDNNISQAARVLGIDRRSLQRKLAKYPPKE